MLYNGENTKVYGVLGEFCLLDMLLDLLKLKLVAHVAGTILPPDLGCALRDLSLQHDSWCVPTVRLWHP